MNKQQRKVAKAKAKAGAQAGNGSKDEQSLEATLGLSPETSEPEAKAEEVTEAIEATTKGGEIDTLLEMEKLAEQIPDEANRNKLLEQIRKWNTESTRSNQVKAWKAFDEELKARLPDIFKELATKHGVELVNRQIRVTFPNGEFSHTNSVVGKGKGGGGNSSRQMPTRWTGKAQSGDQQHDSPNALALALGLQVTGRRDMVDVFESQGYKVTELPKCDRAEKTIAKSDKERAERLNALVKEGGNFVVTKS